MIHRLFQSFHLFYLHGQFTDIEKLTLGSNNLRGLPDEIGNCTTLEELYVNNNAKFSYFPQTCGHLR